jgi:2'-5' RNA ligase
VAESALIVAVPEAEALVGRFREKYDSSAAVGVPAHVTLIYPFLAPDAVGVPEISALTTLFASERPIDVTFARCARFGSRVLYLAPEPQEPLLRLMRRIWERWPECPPYGGTIPADAVRPHLTVSDSVTGDQLDRIDLAVAGGLPVRTRFAEALLIEERTGRWTTRARFAIG